MTNKRSASNSELDPTIAQKTAKMRGRPKADLHCHALLSAPREAYRALGSQVALTASHYGSWAAFERAIAQDFIAFIRRPQDFKAIIDATYAHMIADGIVYAEPSFDLAIPRLLGCDVDEVLAIVDECGRNVADKLTVCPYFGLIRTLPVAAQMQYAEAFATSGLFHGVDLYGDETLGAHRDFKVLFDLASARGLRKKAHAGEFCGPTAIEDAIRIFELDQIQHGIRAIESDATIRLVLDREIELNVCIESNVSLAVAPDRDQHPICKLHRSGVAVTVNSDDFALFHTSVSEDLARLEECGLSEAEVDAIIDLGLRRHPSSPTSDPGTS